MKAQTKSTEKGNCIYQPLVHPKLPGGIRIQTHCHSGCLILWRCPCPSQGSDLCFSRIFIPWATCSLWRQFTEHPLTRFSRFHSMSLVLALLRSSPNCCSLCASAFWNVEKVQVSPNLLLLQGTDIRTDCLFSLSSYRIVFQTLFALLAFFWTYACFSVPLLRQST